MNKEKALLAVDAAIKALTGLEHAIKRSDSRIVDLEVELLWLELGNLRDMVENMEDKDE